MCGICGIIRWDGEPVDEGCVRQMTSLLFHRGPDDEGFHISGEVGLGFRRLSIIDLSGGRQPMTNEDGTVHVVFNGEIYNFKNLRDQLERRGHAFRTVSDTESLLHGYEEWGEDVVHRLQGMFAFAVWDARRRRLFMARDRLGIKPLFYAPLPGAIAFASEIKCLLKVPGVDRALNTRAVLDYFSLLYIPTRQRIYEGIEQLMPGEFLTAADGRVRVSRYWQPQWRPQAALTGEDWCRALQEQLHRSVEAHLVADVPVGLWLSGGIDSSAVAAAMRHVLSGEVLSFSAGFDVPGYDETAHALAVSRHLGTRHEMLPMDASTLDRLPQLLWFLDEPFADPTILPTYLLSRRTRERVKVVLSGEGGDELFGGYTHYQGMQLNRILGSIPSCIRKEAVRLCRKLRLRENGVSGYRLHRLERVLESSLHPPFEDFLQKIGVFSGDEMRSLFTGDFLGDLEDFALMEPMREGGDLQTEKDPIARALMADLRVYLPGDMLTKVDRMSMACSLEVRVPLLDHALVELALSIPMTWKIRGMQTKYILRRTVWPWLPRHIVRRPKRGFNPPLQFWLRANLWEYARECRMVETLGGTGMFHADYIRRLMAEHIGKQSDHGRKLWSLLVFSVWWQRVRDGRGETT